MLKLSGKSSLKKVLLFVVLRGLLSIFFGYLLYDGFINATCAAEMFRYLFLYGAVFLVWLLWSAVVMILLLFKKKTRVANIVGGCLCVVAMVFAGTVLFINDSANISAETAKSNNIAQAVISAAGDYSSTPLKIDPYKSMRLFGTTIEKGEASIQQTDESSLTVTVEYLENVPCAVDDAFWQEEQDSANRSGKSVKIGDEILYPESEWVSGKTQTGTEYLYLYTPIANDLELLVRDDAQNIVCSVCVYSPVDAPIQPQTILNAVVEAIQE